MERHYFKKLIEFTCLIFYSQVLSTARLKVCTYQRMLFYAPFLEEFVSAFSSMTTSSNPRLKVFASFLFPIP